MVNFHKKVSILVKICSYLQLICLLIEIKIAIELFFENFARFEYLLCVSSVIV